MVLREREREKEGNRMVGRREREREREEGRNMMVGGRETGREEEREGGI